MPACPFELTGGGLGDLAEIEGLIGSITGGGGVTVPGAGTLLEITGDLWTATGVLSCTDNGFVRVTIGTQTLDVPVDCTA
jgi:hypothetical protein